MNNELIEKLSNLKMQERYLKKQLDIIWFDKEKKQKIFSEIQSVKKEIDYVKFKLQLERKMRKCK